MSYLGHIRPPDLPRKKIYDKYGDHVPYCKLPTVTKPDSNNAMLEQLKASSTATFIGKLLDFILFLELAIYVLVGIYLILD